MRQRCLKTGCFRSEKLQDAVVADGISQFADITSQFTNDGKRFVGKGNGDIALMNFPGGGNGNRAIDKIALPQALLIIVSQLASPIRRAISCNIFSSLRTNVS